MYQWTYRPNLSWSLSLWISSEFLKVLHETLWRQKLQSSLIKFRELRYHDWYEKFSGTGAPFTPYSPRVKSHWRLLCCNITQSQIADRKFCNFGRGPFPGSAGEGAKFISETICREVVIKVNKANKMDKRLTRRKKKVKTWVVHIFDRSNVV